MLIKETASNMAVSFCLELSLPNLIVSVAFMSIKTRYGFSGAVDSIEHKPVYPYKDVYLDEILFEVESGSQEACDKAAVKKIAQLQKAHDDLYKSRVDKIPDEDIKEAPKYIDHLYRLKDGKKEMFSLWGDTDVNKKILSDVNVIRMGKEPPKVSRKEKWLSFLGFCCFMAILSAIAYIINELFIK